MIVNERACGSRPSVRGCRLVYLSILNRSWAGKGSLSRSSIIGEMGEITISSPRRKLRPGNVSVLRLLAALQRVHERDDAVFGLALEGVVHVGMFGAERFTGENGEVGAAEDGGQPIAFGRLGHRPGVADQGRGGSDADQLVRLARGLGLLDVELDRVVFDGGVIDHDVVTGVAQDRGEIAQAERDVLAFGPDFGFGTGKEDVHLGLRIGDCGFSPGAAVAADL